MNLEGSTLAPSSAAPSNNPSTPRSEWSNRGHKLTGSDNPSGLLRRQLWSPTASANIQIAEDNFKVVEESFIRKVKADQANKDSEDALFLRLYNDFCQQSSLFSKEGIEMKELFKWDNFKNVQLSHRTGKALQNRHLNVLCSLLMLAVEREQVEYRKLMQLAEELCIDEFKMVEEETGLEEITPRKRITEGLDEESVLQLKALCHEHLHAKRNFISLLRKIRSGAVYASFQSNNLYVSLRKLSRRMIRARGFESENESSSESGSENESESINSNSSSQSNNDENQ